MNEKIEQLIAGPLVWLSTLHASAEVMRLRSERARGIDASELEPPAEARYHLRGAVREIEELAFRLEALESEILSDVDELSRTVARFDSLLILNRCAQTLEEIHRRLLSLYPAVEEMLVEEARTVAADCRVALGEGEDIDPARLFTLSAAIRRGALSDGF